MRKFITLIENRQKMILESPLGQWEVSPRLEDNEREMMAQFHGYSQEKKHWPDVDKRTLRSHGHVERVRNAFARSRHAFNLFFWQATTPDYDSFLQRGEVDAEWIRRHLGSDAETVLALGSGNAITIVMTNNLSDEHYISIKSPWMIAHRIAHALEGGSGDITQYFYRFLKKVLTMGYGLEWPDLDTINGRIFAQDYEQIYGKMMGNLLGTMNSARQKKIVQTSEWAYETFAQYMIRGRVDFNPLPDRFDDLAMTTDPKKRARIQRLQEVFPRFIEAYFESVMKNSRGKIFVI